MEIDGKAASAAVSMETDATEGGKDASDASATKTKTQSTPQSVAVASGLPQSREELESLISAIHQTVNNSVLPRLHKCLTAKVRTHQRTHTP